MNQLQREKLGVFFGMLLLICVPYFALQRYPLFPAQQMTPSAFDEWIPFAEEAMWLYVSLYVFLPLPLLWIRQRAELPRMAAGFAAVTLLSHLIFLLWPTAIPEWRPPGTAGSLYAQVLAVDGTINACPSMHASLAVYCVLCCGALLKGRSAARGWNVALWVWTGLILYSTLATRQHVAVDLIAGGLLGGTIYLLVYAVWPFSSILSGKRETTYETNG